MQPPGVGAAGSRPGPRDHGTWAPSEGVTDSTPSPPPPRPPAAGPAGLPGSVRGRGDLPALAPAATLECNLNRDAEGLHETEGWANGLL